MADSHRQPETNRQNEHLSFSIVIPTFNRRETVCDALRAIGRIDYSGPVEVIVVVDGSSDGTAAALAEVECPFPVTILEQANQGAAAARNRGAREAHGGVLLFLDDDMMCDSDILAEHAATLSQGADVVLGHFPLDPGSPPGFLSSSTDGWAADRARRLSTNPDLTPYDLMTGQVSIRRPVFEALGGFDVAFTSGGRFGDEDVDLGARLVGKYDIRFNPRAISRHRYVVTPAENIRRARASGRADVAYARKYPLQPRAHADVYPSDRLLTRLVLRPLSHWPVVTGLLGYLAAWLADRSGPRPTRRRHLVGRFFTACRELAYWKGVHEAGGMPRQRPVLILCYHSISDMAADPVLADYAVPRELFGKHLASLKARGFTFVSPEEVIGHLRDGAGLPRRPALITFDDCYEDLPAIVREVLGPLDIRVAAFAVTGLPSWTNEWDQEIGSGTLHLLRPDDLLELSRDGVEIGCHSRSHRAMAGLARADLTSETSGSRADFAAMGLQPPRLFAYPYGVAPPPAVESVRQAGFVAAFTVHPGRATQRTDPFRLPRVQILSRDTGWRFLLKTAFPITTRVLG